VVARQGDLVPGTGYRWHVAPDGGATFPTPGGWIYVSNSEGVPGGVGAIRFDWRGASVDAYPILSGTRRNCAGGATPWGTWLSCEEVSDGLVYECDPTGARPAVPLPALGRFQHEAVAVDPVERRLYLTEDQPDGALYRFTPNAWGRLDGGTLEVAVLVVGGFPLPPFLPPYDVRWEVVPNPTPGPGQLPTRRQVLGSLRFAGGEGIAWDRGHVYFTTKLDNHVWDYEPRTQELGVLYQSSADPLRQLSGVDNVAATRSGSLVVAEDGGNMELVLVALDGRAQPLLRVLGQSSSELAGPAFDPWGQRLYVSSQRGTDGRGITYEVTGPFFLLDLAHRLGTAASIQGRLRRRRALLDLGAVSFPFPADLGGGMTRRGRR
jgi:secreted PhoX family phosphatase